MKHEELMRKVEEYGYRIKMSAILDADWERTDNKIRAEELYDSIRAALAEAEQRERALVEALTKYERVRDSVGGCSDGGCLVKRPVGMHTNGGCKCHKHELTAKRMMQAGDELYRTLAAHRTAAGEGAQCPRCGAREVDAMTPQTVYGCGSKDYDQRPGTFVAGEGCRPTGER